MVFNIQKFCVHDGPGIRTVVFLKGCNLRCCWCQNPESIFPGPELWYSQTRCIHCGTCIEFCPQHAIQSSPTIPTLNRELCDRCMACTKVCPTKALSTVGEWLTVKDVMEKVDSDRVFYQNSNGGVTFSGGEPTFQFSFLKALLEESGRRGLHRALETNGQLPWRNFKQLLSNIDLVLFDLKHFENQIHRNLVGTGNHLIKKNLEQISKEGVVAWIPRIPLIPGLNNDPRHLAKLGKWLKSLGANKIHLLPYNMFGESKCQEGGYPPQCSRGKLRTPSEDEIETATSIMRKHGLNVEIGG